MHFYRARGLDDDAPRLVVTAPRLPAAAGSQQLGNLARLHRLLANDRIPTVVDAALDAPTPWVSLACDVIGDGDDLCDYIRGTGKIEHRLAAGLIVWVMETLAAVHRVVDPETGAAVGLGSLAFGNLMFGADGRIWLVGFGGVPLDDACVAPEVADGGDPAPPADVYSVAMFMRVAISLIEMAPMAKRISAGVPLPDDLPAARRATAINVSLTTPPQGRPTMAATLANAQEAFRLFGFVADVEAFSAFVARALAAGPERLANRVDPGGALRIGRDADWLETPNGMHHTLRARRPLRRVLHALAEARRARTGAALSVHELLQAGWPGESPLPEAGNNRVYVAISTLRKLGLGELLQRCDGGYRLDPDVSIDVE